MSVSSNIAEVRIPEPNMNLNPAKILTFVCWNLHLFNSVVQEPILWKT